MSIKEIVGITVSGLGYDLVEIENTSAGLLRITIDFPWVSQSDIFTNRFITVEDCEKVTRQLQFALEVDEVQYSRLEVSSPGIDRLLRHEMDFIRFIGEVVDITLKEPIGISGNGHVNSSRKKFRGKLARNDGVVRNDFAGWKIEWSDLPETKPGQRISKKRASTLMQVMSFTHNDVKEVRLAPIVNFKGRITKDDIENI